MNTSHLAGLLRRAAVWNTPRWAGTWFALVIVAIAAFSTGSVALTGFGLDSLIEIGASTVVIWQLADTSQPAREHRGIRLIGAGFALLVIYLLTQVTYTFATDGRPAPSKLGIIWTALTFLVMLALATGKARTGKARTGKALGNPVLTAEGRVTLIDALLAAAVLLGLALNAALGWW